MRMKKGLICVMLMTIAVNLNGQGYELKSTVGIYKDVQELQRGVRVLYLAAHPDDENTRLISWLENDQHIETAYLSLTRGQGGQNLIGDEKGDGLGVIRTYELLEARKIDGGEQFFTRAIDFGYSKSAEESFELWGKDEVLQDVVYVIRKFRPHMIITRFPPTRRAGHGHHEASALLAEEAFDLAADPAVFPEQLKNLQPWQAEYLYHNTSSWWDKSLDDLDPAGLKERNMLRLDVGVYNDLLGYNMNEIASLARSKHRCQAFGTMRARGSQTEYLSLVKGEWSDDPFGEIEGVWKQSPGHAEALAKVVDEFNFTDRNANFEILKRNFYPMLAQRNMWAEAQDINEVMTRVNQLKWDLSGVRVEVFAGEEAVVIGEKYEVMVEVFNSSSQTQTVEFKHAIIDTSLTVAPLQSIMWSEILTAPLKPSNPFWLVNEHNGWLYDIDKSCESGMPTMPDEVVQCLIKVDGQFVKGESELHRKWNDRSIGEIMQPMLFVNPVSINPQSNSIIVTQGDSALLLVDVIAHTNAENISLKATLPVGWKVAYDQAAFSLKKGQRKSFAFSLQPLSNAAIGNIAFTVQVARQLADQSSAVIAYDHIPETTIYTKAQSKLVPLDLTISRGAKVLYIEGSGDEVDDALMQMGYTVESKNLGGTSLEELAQYKAIVVGIRAFNVNDDLAANVELLHKYANQGGNVIVQYNTTYGLKVEQIAPFPITLGRDRVTDETSEVKVLDSKHPMLNQPHQISSADWQGWVQERGLYFASEWDKAFEPLIAWNDKDEEAVKGGLLVANYGKGSFTYTGISFFRELPAGVPGAYRLMVNLIEYQP